MFCKCSTYQILPILYRNYQRFLMIFSALAFFNPLLPSHTPCSHLNDASCRLGLPPKPKRLIFNPGIIQFQISMCLCMTSVAQVRGISGVQTEFVLYDFIRYKDICYGIWQYAYSASDNIPEYNVLIHKLLHVSPQLV